MKIRFSRDKFRIKLWYMITNYPSNNQWIVTISIFSFVLICMSSNWADD